MSYTTHAKPAATEPNAPWPQWVRNNVAAWFALLHRPPRVMPASAWWAAVHPRVTAGVAVLTVGFMVALDAQAVTAARRLPLRLIEFFDWLTDFGKSSWFLWPVGLLLIVFPFLAAPSLPRLSRLTFAAISVRLTFLFLAIGLPSLFASVVKRLIGRSRPFVGGEADPFLFAPFGWRVEFASLPSGHATTAFAVAVAVGALWPRTRVLMWTYALAIAVSRVVLTAHHPSDVLAGALVGAFGALLVRNWFAARRLGFAPAPGGGIGPLPGPSLRRIKTVARQVFAP
ncbi:MAG: phosphatase PAP2 family protein [Xanthobacteraceae bacterium]